jgi:hypothetical protein
VPVHKLKYTQPVSYSQYFQCFCINIFNKIVSIADALEKGRWINSSLILARIVDKPTTRIMAYVNENDLTEIAVGHTFLPRRA